jgi:hypothetical protein
MGSYRQAGGAFVRCHSVDQARWSVPRIFLTTMPPVSGVKLALHCYPVVGPHADVA